MCGGCLPAGMTGGDLSIEEEIAEENNRISLLFNIQLNWILEELVIQKGMRGRRASWKARGTRGSF